MDMAKMRGMMQEMRERMQQMQGMMARMSVMMNDGMDDEQGAMAALRAMNIDRDPRAKAMMAAEKMRIK